MKVIKTLFLLIFFVSIESIDASLLYDQNLSQSNKDNGSDNNHVIEIDNVWNWSVLKTMSATEIRAHLEKNSIQISSYLDEVLRTCETMDKIFGDNSTPVSQKCELYENLILHTKNNYFIEQVNIFYNKKDGATQEDVKNLLGINNRENDEKICTLISLCFVNYIHNPFNKSVLSKKTKLSLHNVLHPDKGNVISFDNDYLFNFVNPKYEKINTTFKQSILDDTKEEAIFDETEQSITESKFLDLINKYNIKDETPKTGLWNFFKHYIPAEEKKFFLKTNNDEKRKNRKTNCLLTYKYFLKPVVFKALKLGKDFSDISLLEEAFSNCIYNANKELLQIIKTLSDNLQKSTSINPLVKDTCKTISNKINALIDKNSAIKSYPSFWTLSTDGKGNIDIQDFLLSKNGINTPSKFDISLLIDPTQDFLTKFKGKYGISENGNNQLFDKLDTLLKEQLIVDPIKEAERQYNKNWLRQLFSILWEKLNQVTPIVLPSVIEYLTAGQKDAEKKALEKQMKEYQSSVDDFFYAQYCAPKIAALHFKTKEEEEKYTRINQLALLHGSYGILP